MRFRIEIREDNSGLLWYMPQKYVESLDRWSNCVMDAYSYRSEAMRIINEIKNFKYEPKDVPESSRVSYDYI